MTGYIKQKILILQIYSFYLKIYKIFYIFEKAFCYSQVFFLCTISSYIYLNLKIDYNPKVIKVKKIDNNHKYALFCTRKT